MSGYRQPREDGQFELRFGGGLNERNDFNINLEECTEGYNFLLDVTGRTLAPRLPQDLEATAPNAEVITGILQLVTQANAVSQVVVAGDTCYDWDGSSTFTDVTPPLFTSGGASGSRMRAALWSLDGYIIITDVDLNNLLYKWNGTSITRLKTDLLGGNSQSVNALTCAGATATAVVTAHGYSSGDLVTIAGANETEYNGEYEITVGTASDFTYAMSCSTTPATGTITAEKGVELKAKYCLIVDGRSWLFNVVADGTSTPHMILVSAFEDPEDYDNSVRGTAQGGGATGNDAFYLLAPDLRAINGAVQFYNTVIISTDGGKLFKLTGTDAEDYNFVEFYPGSSAQGDEALVNIGNDLLYFRRGQEVESLTSTEKFGDVSTDDLSFWIPRTIKLATNPLVVYDQTNQYIYFFDSGLGGILVLDKEYLLFGQQVADLALSPWMYWKTLMSNDFTTRCAVQVRDPTGVTDKRCVLWGDSAGQIFRMDGTAGEGDAGTTNVSLYRKTRAITELDTNMEVLAGRLEYKRLDAATASLVFNWLDEYHRETLNVGLKGSFGLGGAFFWGEDEYWGESDLYWSTGRVVSEQLSTLGWSVPGKGSGFFLELQISDTTNYLISRLFV